MLKATVIGLSTFIFAAFCAAVVVFAQTPTSTSPTVSPTTSVTASPTFSPTPIGQVQGDKTIPSGAPNTGRGGK